MRIRTDEGVIVGQALDLRDSTVDVERIREALRDDTDPTIDCGPPAAIHDEIGTIREGMDLDVRAALVAAGRSLGLSTPFDDEIARLDAQISAIDADGPDLRSVRRRAASAGESVDTLRERVARIGGRLTAIREAGGETAEVEAALREATRELSEAETDAIAARQAMDAAERRARAARDRRADRLSLVDRRENRRRDARSWLVDRMAPRLETAMASLPVRDLEGGDGSPIGYDGPPRHLALGVLRLARVVAPVLLADSPFESPLRARAALDAPVVMV